MPKQYRSLLKAESGTLLGDAKEVRSIWFTSMLDAENWSYQAIRANREANRTVRSMEIEIRARKQEKLA